MRAYFFWLAKFLTVVFVLAFIVPIMLAAVLGAGEQAMQAKHGRGQRTVAVVELSGIIHDSREVIEELYKQADNEKVKGIVLRVDSPGGAVGPSQEIYAAVKQLKTKKPIVASMGGVAASGGLYVSLAASRILCQPGTLTGSIGVILQLPNFTKVSERIGVDMITIKSGKLKDAGNSFRLMTDEDRQFLQDTVHTAHKDFLQAVADGRGIDRSKVEAFADGRVILGSQALELKLVDGFGDVMDAARAVFELRGEPLAADEAPDLYYPGDKFREFKKLFESFSSLPDYLRSSMSLQYIMN